MSFNPCPKPIAPPKAPKRLNKVNRARVADNFKRCYHSRARQKLVNLMACSACGTWGFSENAHVLGVDGASLKGPYKSVAPLCGPRPDGSDVYEGCHRLSHRDPAAFRERYPTFNPRKAARQAESRWQAFLRGDAGGLPTQHEDRP